MENDNNQEKDFHVLINNIHNEKINEKNIYVALKNTQISNFIDVIKIKNNLTEKIIHLKSCEIKCLN